jgi:hypothetical protein
VLDMQLAGQHDKANQQLNLLNDIQRTSKINASRSIQKWQRGVAPLRRQPSNASDVSSG